MSVKVLHGHDSFETAYVVADYPFGRSIRCAQRVWIETKAKLGQRLVSQTTKKVFNTGYVPGETPVPTERHMYNAFKTSTYSHLRVMFIDEATGYVENDGIQSYSGPDDFQRFEGLYGSQFDDDQRARFNALKAMSQKMNPNSWAEHDAKQAG